MNKIEAIQIVTNSLKKRGASCRLDFGFSDAVNIIAVWKSTVWRIIVKPIENKEEIYASDIGDEVESLRQSTNQFNQVAVVAWVISKSSIEYRAAKDNKIVRPRSLVKNRKTKILYHE